MSAAASDSSWAVPNSAHTEIIKPDLERFFSAVNDKINFSQPQTSRTDLVEFFSSVGEKIEQQRTIDRHDATRFNIFNVIDPDENKLSDIIADLLNPRGDHGQGDLFLQLLFKQVGLDSDLKLLTKATVHREAPTHGINKYRRRMDIFIDAGTLVAIENKVDAQEQIAQVSDYLDHLDYCTKGRSIKSTLIFLTPEGIKPDSLSDSGYEKAKGSVKLHCWSYQRELREWLKNCFIKCEAQRIKFFLKEFILFIELSIKQSSEDTEEEEAEHEEWPNS